MEPISVQVVTEDPDRCSKDLQLLRSIPSLDVSTLSPLKFMLNSGRVNFNAVAVLELPFIQENEVEFMEVLSRSQFSVPMVIVSDEPLRYLPYARGGRISIVPREPGYSSELPEAIMSAYRYSRDIAEKAIFERRLQEYSQYLETINKIMEHDIGDLNQAILTFSELLKKSNMQPNMKIVESIIEQSKTVANLINSFATLAHLAKGNVEELSMEAKLLDDAINEGIKEFSSITGDRFDKRIEVDGSVRVIADSSLPQLFRHIASYVKTMNPECNHFEITVYESFALENTVSVTISPRGRFASVLPKYMKHIEDLNALLKGNVDLMSMVILSRRYGGSISLNVSESGGKEYNFITVALPKV
jgi:hypothetical protein